MAKKRHILKLAKKAKANTIQTVQLDAHRTAEMILYTYDNRDGFVHFARFTINFTHVADAKIAYLNRTWERFTGESVYKQALNHAIASGYITEEEKTKIIGGLR